MIVFEKAKENLKTSKYTFSWLIKGYGKALLQAMGKMFFHVFSRSAASYLKHRSACCFSLDVID